MSRPDALREPLVLKFGGTSVGSPERIKRVARYIAKLRAQEVPCVVVVSAMGQTTDELLELARQVSDSPPPREVDMLLSAGERISMALLSMALADLGVSAVSLTGSQSGIITDGNHRRAQIKKILGTRVRAGLNSGKVVIVAGFQGVSEQKEITTLGRGGSDTTAVALAASLEVQICEIWTDVDGVFSGDPSWVPGAVFYPKVSSHWMLEMAAHGAGVLHSRCVEIAKKYGIVIRVRNSLKIEGAHQTQTEVLPSGSTELEGVQLMGVTGDSNQVLVSVELERPTVLGAVWDEITREKRVVTNPFFQGTQVWFFIEKSAVIDLETHLKKLRVEGFVKSFEVNGDWVPLTLVGICFLSEGGTLQRVVECLAKKNILTRLGSSSASSVTVAVPSQYLEDGILAIHEEFIREEFKKEMP